MSIANVPYAVTLPGVEVRPYGAEQFRVLVQICADFQNPELVRPVRHLQQIYQSGDGLIHLHDLLAIPSLRDQHMVVRVWDPYPRHIGTRSSKGIAAFCPLIAAFAAWNHARI